MANGMKLWTGILFVAAALLSIQWLPPQVYSGRPAEPLTEEEVEARTLRSEIVRSDGILKRIRWVRDFEDYLAENAYDGLVVAGAGQMSSDTVAAFRRLVEDELDRLPTRDPEATVGIFWVALESGGHGNVPVPGLEGAVEFYIGARDGKPYCFSVKPEVQRNLTDRRIRYDLQRNVLSGNALGGCRYVAAYGAPGTQVLAWLEEGAMSFANTERNTLRQYSLWQVRSRGAFGIAHMSYANQRIEVDQCLGGVSDACLGMVLHPKAQRIRLRDEDAIIKQSPVTSIYRMTTLGVPGSMLFDDIETEFGPEAFDRFWSSDLEVEASFEAAFGVGMNTWLVDWVDQNFEPFTAGPALTQSARFGGLLTIMLLGLIAGLWNRRRRVA